MTISVKRTLALSLFLFASVSAFALHPIAGPDSCCVGAHVTLLENRTRNGVWSSSDPAIASVDSATGVVTGVSQGATVISFSQKGKSVTVAFRVVAPVNPGVITGEKYVTLGKTITLRNLAATKEHYWSSSAPGIADIDYKSGIVRGISSGVAIISCNVRACDGLYTTTKVFTTTADCIAGLVTFPGGYVGPVKVSLIHCNPTTGTVETTDSAIYQCGDSSVFYQFTGVRTDSFRVRASVIDTTTYRYGFNTTYYPGNYLWFNGNVVHHNSGIPDRNIDITMKYGRFEH